MWCTGQLYGLEKFWAFRKYYRQARALHTLPELETALHNFRRLEDFRVLPVREGSHSAGAPAALLPALLCPAGLLAIDWWMRVITVFLNACYCVLLDAKRLCGLTPA